MPARNKNTSTAEFTTYLISPEDQRVEGCFTSPATAVWRKCEEDLENTLYMAATMPEYISSMLDIIKREPCFLDAYVHLGLVHLNNNFIDDALTWYQEGLNIALPAIPPDFVGAIPWANLENRPFLRLHHGYILCLMKKKQYKEAVERMEEHLAWNPSDNIGVRYLIGDAYLHAGMAQKARKYYKDSFKNYPPAAYSLGLLEFKRKRYAEAATILRQGFMANVYIAELLTGRSNPRKHFFWHSNNFQEPELAQWYAESGGLELWEKTEGAVDFIDWLFNSAVILRERAEVTAAREGLTYEHAFDMRDHYSSKLIEISKSITIESSKKLIRREKDRFSTDHWPWQHGGPNRVQVPYNL